MKYKYIGEYELASAYPKHGISCSSVITSDKKNEYIKLYNKYRQMFTQFLLSKTNIKELDEKLNKIEYIKPLDKSQMDIYQYCVSDELQYMYIRNNIYIGKLTEKEKHFLERVNFAEEDLSQDELEFVEQTFERVIAEGEGEGRTQANFGNSNVGFLAMDNSIVIGLRYNPTDVMNLNLVLQAYGFCELINNQISTIKGTNLGVPIVGHIYSEYEVNVIPKKIKTENERN